MLTYEQARDIRNRENALHSWMKERKRNWYKAEEVAHLNPPTNEERSELEVFEFCSDIPDRYFLYVDDDKGLATTWTGQTLGTIQFGNTWRSSFGDRRTAITVHAINGRRYVGTYYQSAGDYARIRLVKGQLNV